MVKYNIKIESKHLWLISAIFVFLGGAGFVIAYNAAGTGGNPQIMGHSGDELEVECVTLKYAQTVADGGAGTAVKTPSDFGDAGTATMGETEGGVFYPSIACNLANGWTMTGCAATAKGAANEADLGMGANNCWAAPDDTTKDIVFVRCCKFGV